MRRLTYLSDVIACPPVVQMYAQPFKAGITWLEQRDFATGVVETTGGAEIFADNEWNSLEGGANPSCWKNWGDLAQFTKTVSHSTERGSARHASLPRSDGRPAIDIVH